MRKTADVLCPPWRQRLSFAICGVRTGQEPPAALFEGTCSLGRAHWLQEDLGGSGPHRRKLLAGAALGFHFLGMGLLFSSFWGDRRRGITFNVR
jgi:hypothetical protein